LQQRWFSSIQTVTGYSITIFFTISKLSGNTVQVLTNIFIQETIIKSQSQTKLIFSKRLLIAAYVFVLTTHRQPNKNHPYSFTCSFFLFLLHNFLKELKTLYAFMHTNQVREKNKIVLRKIFNLLYDFKKFIQLSPAVSLGSTILFRSRSFLFAFQIE
jgi:hypothetical protein